MKCVNETLPVASFSIYSVCHVFGEFNREIGGNLQNILIHLKPESNMNPVPKKSFFNIQYPWCILPPNTENFSTSGILSVSRKFDDSNDLVLN